MVAKRIISGDSAIFSLLDGTTLVCRAVSGMLGPRGRPVAIARQDGGITVTKDGLTVANSISPSGSMGFGAALTRSAGSKTSEAYGDGSTTTMVLTGAMLAEGVKRIMVGVSPATLRVGMDIAVRVACSELQAMASETHAMVHARRAATTAGGDALIGQLAAEALGRFGPDAAISVVENVDDCDELVAEEGLHIDRGFISVRFATAQEKPTASLHEPLILLLDGPASSLPAIMPVLEKARQLNRPLLLIAHSFSVEVLSTLAFNHAQGRISCVPVEAPGPSTLRTHLLQDIGVVVGARIIQDISELAHPDMDWDALGSAAAAEIDARTTRIVGGDGPTQALQSHADTLRLQIAHLEPGEDLAALRRRLAYVQSGICLIKVGSRSAQERSEKRTRVLSALRAARAALEGGVVPGGGAALIRAQGALSELRIGDEEYAAGVQVVSRAIEEPLRVIVSNAGREPTVIVNAVRKSAPNKGWDVTTDELADLYERGIVDPVDIVISALQNAASAATLMLSAACVIERDTSEPVVDSARS
ncbi:chaperonin GroEL [Burkholderia multivorans]|nr:chaperonin GroEL [Burkholderia multivorans]